MSVIETFNDSLIMERVWSVETACKELGEDDEEVKQLRLVQNIPSLSKSIIHTQELKVVVKALNGKWELDISDSTQFKCFNQVCLFFTGFPYRNYGYALIYTHKIRSDSSHEIKGFYFKSIELATYAKEQFKWLYEKIYLEGSKIKIGVPPI